MAAARSSLEDRIVPGGSVSPWLARVALAATGIIVLCALGFGVARRYLDHDEIQHAHVVWLISMGDRPFHDFVETHPPFVWYLGVPLVRFMPSASAAFFALRGAAAVAGLVFVGLLVGCARAGQPALQTRWLLGGLLLMLSNEKNLDYFLEARPDSVSYGLLLLGFVLFQRGVPNRILPRYATFAFVSSTAILWMPKLVLLVVVFALADLLLVARGDGTLRAALAGHAAGIGLALVGAIVFLYAVGIDPVVAYEMTYEFHARWMPSASFDSALGQAILAQPVQLFFAGCGLLVWLFLVAKKRVRPTPFEVGVAGFLVFTHFLVAAPYKQYFAPWFVLAAIFVAYLGAGFRLAGRRVAELGLVILLGVALIGGWLELSFYSNARGMNHYRKWWTIMARVAEPDGRVIAWTMLHPISRRDVFYYWHGTSVPLSDNPLEFLGGRDSEALFREWNPGGYGDRATRQGYVEQIARHPPAIIVTYQDGFALPVAQEQVVASFLERHGDDYVRVHLPGPPGSPDLLVRRDQADWDYLETLGHSR